MNRFILLALALAGAVLLLGDRFDTLFASEAPKPVSVAANKPGVQVAKVSAPAGQGRIVALEADRRGHFIADVGANNQFISVMVDTGASIVALTSEDARKIGISARDSVGRSQISTANGVIEATLVRIPELRLQGIRVNDVEAVVLPPGASRVTLLGMSFLKQLRSFEMQGATLVLRQ